MTKLRQSVSATARREAERQAAKQLPLLTDIDFDNSRQLKDAATRIAKAIRAEAGGSRLKHRKLLLRMSQRPEFQRVGAGRLVLSRRTICLVSWQAAATSFTANAGPLLAA